MQDLLPFESNSQPCVIRKGLSLNLNDYSKPNLTIFSSLTKTKSYIPLASCVLEHILTNNNFTNCEKLYYLTADSLALINKNQGGGRYCALPSEDWAEHLGCSRSLIFQMQKSLVEKGYFIINKDFDEIGRNKRNLITPTLPTSVFNHLNERFPSRVGGERTPYDLVAECKRSYLDRTKLFIKLNYQLLLAITTNLQLNSLQKIIWLGFYTRCYKNYMLQTQDSATSGKYSGKYIYNNGDNNSFSFISSYQELSTLYFCSTKHLSKSIRVLEQLGFVKSEQIYIRKKHTSNSDSHNRSESTNKNDYRIQERQDQSLWKITLSLPKEYILELEKVKNRSNFKTNDIEALTSGDNVDSITTHDCLILDGIKFNLTSKQASSLKSVIIVDDNNMVGDNTDSFSSSLPHSDLPPYDTYIKELDSGSKLEEFSDFSKKLNPLETFDNKDNSNDVIKSDPSFAKSALLLLNKDLILKIKEFRSNLRAKPKVIFNDFLIKLKRDNDNNNNENNQKQRTKPEFNICSELIRNKLRILPKDKADKARKFAYCLVSKKLASGYAAGLNKHELAKQLIHHAATWKPTKLGYISREQEIDTALAVAWKAIIAGTWQPPLEFAKAEILNYEYQHYCKKYQESGIMSHGIKSLESEVDKLLGRWSDLEGRIFKAASANGLPASSIDITEEENFLSQSATGVFNQEKSDVRTIEFNSIKAESNLLGSNSGKMEDRYDITGITNNENRQKFDISHLPEKETYFRVYGTENDRMVLENVSNISYYGKLEELELTNDNKMILVFAASSCERFLEMQANLKPQLPEQNSYTNQDLALHTD